MSSDVIVIGGGVIGLLSAWRLAQAGLAVELFEKSKVGAESSWAALGVLTPHAGPLLKLAQASLALYPSVASALREQSNIDIELRDEGMLYVALSHDEVESLQARALRDQAAGVPVQSLTAREARELEPALSERVCGALYYTATRQVNNVQLFKALAIATTRAGAKIHEGKAVTRLRRDGYGITGVQVDAETHNAAWVVIAAGSWSGEIEGINVPVRPVKGEALAVDAASIAPLTISHVIDSQYGYVVPRADGRLLIGATVEDVGFDKRVNDEAAQALLAGARRVVPALQNADVRESWAGLRPCSADGLPIIGPVAQCAGLIVATGHFRNGILLAPITAQLVTEWISDQKPTLDMQLFSPDRFAR